MSGHTPGPWVPHEWRVFAAGEHGNLICDCAEDRDARLIAAAPEMYEALKRLEVEIGEGDARGRAIDLLPRATVGLLRDAIAKAEGRT